MNYTNASRKLDSLVPVSKYYILSYTILTTNSHNFKKLKRLIYI